jgi:N-acetyl sugar amidotransferase
MKYCTQCLLPSTRPNLSFNNLGICTGCLNYKNRADVNWVDRRNQLIDLVAQAKTKKAQYDCVVPVSGGKDSTWQIIQCLELGLKVLAITWKTPGRNEIGKSNLDNLISLGVDHIDFTINPKIEKEFMLKTFIKSGSPAIPMHLAIFSIPLRFALLMGIPLVVYGENSAVEYGGANKNEDTSRLSQKWVDIYGVTQGTSVSDWVDEQLQIRDLLSYAPPSELELSYSGIKSIFLGHYFQWDPRLTRDIAAANGFKARELGALTGYYEFADIDDEFISVHHWLKWYKFGFTRAFDNLSLDIRKGLITRNEALSTLVNLGDQIPVQNITSYCEYVGISYTQFMEYSEKFRNLNIWQKNTNGKWYIPDFIIPNWRWI